MRPASSGSRFWRAGSAPRPEGGSAFLPLSLSALPPDEIMKCSYAQFFCIALIALIIFLIGWYVFSRVSFSKRMIPHVQIIANEIAIYENNFIKLHIPDNVSVHTGENKSVNFSHTLAVTHQNYCDFIGNAPSLSTLDDRAITIYLNDGDIRDVIDMLLEKTEAWKDIVDAQGFFTGAHFETTVFNAGNVSGHKVLMGVEGCGRIYYFFTIKGKVLAVTSIITPDLEESHPAFAEYKARYGVLSLREREVFIRDLIASAELK